MNKEVIKPIAVAAFIGTVIFSTLGFMDFYMTKVSGASLMENRRIAAEKADIIKVKCLEPTNEFRIKETSYLKDYNLLFNPASKYDILGSTSSDSNIKQFTEATTLKMDEDLASSGCEEAKQEVSTMKDTDKWTYFQANWKRMMFNKA